MAHQHNVYDTDKHFVIDPNTRKIENQSKSKVTLIQNDHDSERFTFEIQRYVEGHDMSISNKVEVHFINIAADNSEKNADVYPVTDLQVSPDSEDVVICSWLISRNATKYIGTLHFALRFACLTDDIVEYDWRTGIYSDFPISETIFNSETVVAEYSDVLEQWKQEVLEGVGSGLPEGGTEGQVLTKTADGEAWSTIDIPEQVNADWSVSDESDPAYVKNRTHWEADGEAVTFDWDRRHDYFELSGQCYYRMSELVPTKDEFVGAEILEFVDFNGKSVINYDAWLGTVTEDEIVEYDWGFVYGSAYTQILMIVHDVNVVIGSYTATAPNTGIYTICDMSNEDAHVAELKFPDVVHTLDLKYLPDTVAMKTDIPDTSRFLTAVPDEYVTETELTAKGYLTAVPSEYVTETELTAKGYQTAEQVNALINTALGVIENGAY